MAALNRSWTGEWRRQQERRVKQSAEALRITDIMSTFIEKSANPGKLVSLLALATGAIAMPQSGSANVIVTDLTGNPATVSGTGSYPLTGLPSGVNFGFQGRVRSSGGTYYRSVIAGKMGGTASVEIQGSGGFAVQRAKGSAWNNGFTPYATALVAKASHLIGSTGATAHSPGSYSTHKYLSFSFKDASEGNLRSARLGGD